MFDPSRRFRDDLSVTRWVEINTGSPVYRIRDDHVVEINTGNPVYRMRA